MLLQPDTLDQEREALKALSHQDQANRFINEDVRLEMAVQLGDLVPGHSIHYMTEARWHLHDLLVYCLGQTGPADLYLCMYAVKEYQANMIASMKSRGLIRELHVLLDYRSGVNHADALQILRANADSIGAIRTHAKLVVLRNDQMGVVITGSANLTANTRSDAGVITCDTTVANYRIEYIKAKINATKA
ncbi:MAG: hypothetical protein JSS76_08500 [Bacteroidetes bacterium]|nr:hypothetical protein [Bacteroidota bacterium]